MGRENLCERCRRIPAKLFQVVDEVTWSRVITHSSNYSQLQDSATTCRLCGIFLKYIDDWVDRTYNASRLRLVEQNPAVVLKNMYGENQDQQRNVWLAISDKKEDDIEESDYVTPFSDTLNLCYSGDEATIPFLENALDSSASIEVATNWLINCLNRHDDCPKSQSTFLPTRLIEVGSNGCEARLCLTTDFDHEQRKIQYTTLSYCWGKNPDASGITTTLNLSERLNTISINTLPQTLQDAIIITRSLHIPYLWIDALCILQDCPEDWQRESALMAPVYTNAYCTIAASTASSSDLGCLQRKSLAAQACKLSWPPTHPRDGDFSVTIYPEKLSPKKVLEECALAKRGWTLQEMRLSPRTLHFTDAGLVWSCRTMKASDQDPAIDSVTPDPYAEFYKRLDEHQKPIKPWKEWREAVEQYSRRSLTVVTDRLPALAGLASRMQVETGDTYLAGLWKADLVHDLMWYREKDIPPLTPCPTYIAPSWSWASRLGPVTACFFEIGAMKPISGDTDLDSSVLAKEIETNSKRIETATPSEREAWVSILGSYKKEAAVVAILKTGVTTRGENPFGDVSAGFLEIQGKIRKARMLNRKDDLARFGKDQPNIELQTGQFILPLLDVELGEEKQEDKMIGSCTPDFEVQRERSEELVYCLQLSTNTVPLYGSNETSGVVLILKPSGLKENEYQRVGLGDIQVGKWFHDCEKTSITIV